MKNLTKYLTYVLTALALLVLVGCSRTKEPTVRSTVAELIGVGEISGDENVAKEPSSLVLVGHSKVDSHFRSNSVWISPGIVKEYANR